MTNVILCVLQTCITSCTQQVLIILVVEVSEQFHMGQQQMYGSHVETLLTSLTNGYNILRQITFGVVIYTKKNE